MEWIPKEKRALYCQKKEMIIKPAINIFYWNEQSSLSGSKEGGGGSEAI